MLLALSQRALVIFDGFKGQNTPSFLETLEKENIGWVKIPPNCTDKLQPMDITVNKSMKTQMRNNFHSYYAKEVQTKILSGVPIEKIQNYPQLRHQVHHG